MRDKNVTTLLLVVHAVESIIGQYIIDIRDDRTLLVRGLNVSQSLIHSFNESIQTILRHHCHVYTKV